MQPITQPESTQNRRTRRKAADIVRAEKKKGGKRRLANREQLRSTSVTIQRRAANGYAEYLRAAIDFRDGVLNFEKFKLIFDLHLGIEPKQEDNHAGNKTTSVLLQKHVGAAESQYLRAAMSFLFGDMNETDFFTALSNERMRVEQANQ